MIVGIAKSGSVCDMFMLYLLLCCCISVQYSYRSYLHQQLSTSTISMKLFFCFTFTPLVSLWRYSAVPFSQILRAEPIFSSALLHLFFCTFVYLYVCTFVRFYVSTFLYLLPDLCGSAFPGRLAILEVKIACRPAIRQNVRTRFFDLNETFKSGQVIKMF